MIVYSGRTISPARFRGQPGPVLPPEVLLPELLPPVLPADPLEAPLELVEPVPRPELS
jgi:hypothetical protein